MSDRTRRPRPAANDASAPSPPRARPGPPPGGDPDAEIEALLDFEPVPRKVRRPDGWTPELQRDFVRLLAETGSPMRAAEALGKNVSGIEAVYRTKGADSFRAAWDRALDIGRRRRAEAERGATFQGRAPGLNLRASPGGSSADAMPLPGQVMNERFEWEDEASFLARAEGARDSIRMKLLRCRRVFLAEISACPGKRAAFEILTELPVDWDKAERMEPQADEPCNAANQRQADMVLTAESGWSWGEIGYGPDRKAELRKAIDKWRRKKGLEPVDWDAE